MVHVQRARSIEIAVARGECNNHCGAPKAQTKLNGAHLAAAIQFAANRHSTYIFHSDRRSERHSRYNVHRGYNGEITGGQWVRGGALLCCICAAMPRRRPGCINTRASNMKMCSSPVNSQHFAAVSSIPGQSPCNNLLRNPRARAPLAPACCGVCDRMNGVI